MRSRSLTPLATALLMSAFMILAVSGIAAAAETTFTADLEGGAAEVPPGDPDGSGSATFTIDPAEGTLCFEITVEAIMPATAAHIHVGGPGVAGDVVVPLDTDGFEGTADDCIEPMEDAQALQDIVDDPAGFYVNVHTDDYPGGAVRGQLAASAAPNTAVGGTGSLTPLTLLGVVGLVLGSVVLLVRGARAR